jgi:hypothetical protein
LSSRVGNTSGNELAIEEEGCPKQSPIAEVIEKRGIHNPTTISGNQDEISVVVG